MKYFHATSLEQIAKMFDRLAEQAENSSRLAKQKSQAKLHMREATTWKCAASTIRQTQLEPVAAE